VAQGGGVICHGDERTTDPSFSDGPWGRESLRSSARRDREPRGDRAARWAGKGAARSPGSGLQGPFPFLQIGVSKLGAREAGRGHVAGRPRARMTMGGALCALRELQRGYLVLEVHLPSGAVRQEAVEPGRARRAEDLRRVAPAGSQAGLPAHLSHLRRHLQGAPYAETEDGSPGGRFGW
jgi:hypothetical protein